LKIDRGDDVINKEHIRSVLFKSPALTSALRATRALTYYFSRSPHEADFCFLADPKYKGGFLLDLGANIGNSAISATKVQPSLRVFSVEANPACESGLKMTRRVLGGRFEYRLVGVGAQPGQLAFFVPERSSRMLLEEGTFERSSLESKASLERIGRIGVDYELKTLSIPMVTVDSLNLQPTIVKMDLQGLEMQALNGMRQTIERCWPTFMIEIGEHHDEVEAFLVGLGYKTCHWDGQTLQPGVRPDTLNAIFVRP